MSPSPRSIPPAKYAYGNILLKTGCAHSPIPANVVDAVGNTGIVIYLIIYPMLSKIWYRPALLW